MHGYYPASLSKEINDNSILERFMAGKSDLDI
jgi:hypothetical protein